MTVEYQNVGNLPKIIMQEVRFSRWKAQIFLNWQPKEDWLDVKVQVVVHHFMWQFQESLKLYLSFAELQGFSAQSCWRTGTTMTSRLSLRQILS